MLKILVGQTSTASKSISKRNVPFFIVFYRVSGVTDHYAHNDEHALSIARSIVANLNKQTSFQLGCLPFEEPVYSMDDMYSVIPSDPKKSFDVRKVILLKCFICNIDNLCFTDYCSHC